MKNRFSFLCICTCFLIYSNVFAQTSMAPVLFKGDTILVIQKNIGAFSVEQRAEMISQNIKSLTKLPLSDFDSISVMVRDVGADVVYKEKVIVSVTNDDAVVMGTTTDLLAEAYKNRIKEILIQDYNDTSWSELAKDILFFILALVGLFLFFQYVNRFFDYLRANLKTVERNVFFRKNKIIQFFKLITPETERNLLLFILRMLRFTVLGVFLYLYLPFLFQQISYTRGFGEKLFDYVLSPLIFLWQSFTGYLPKFLFIVIIIIAVRYLIRGLEYIASEIRRERIRIDGFYPDWAKPTFNLFKVLVVIFTLVIVFPYLPGAGSDAFQGVSVFIGLLLSLGSAGAISNVISGVILTYMRPFQIGDRVKINDVTGDVVSRNLLVTRVKTLKNEEITLPNASMLSGGIVNYTSRAKEYGLVLHTTITIGYDAPWQQVHQLLIDAATKTEWIESEPTPFVLQKSLEDWYVAYELNAYTKESHKVPRIYSDLHANIQDVFNEAGLEIMSSHYLAIRDGNPMAVPKEALPKDYKVPSFGIKRKN